MKTKKLLCVALAASTLASTTLTGCFSSMEQEYDPNKTQLFVQIRDGGYGREWADKMGERFEAKYANESFQEDKTGVEVIVRYVKEALNIDQVPYGDTDLYFEEKVFPGTWASVALDITDLVTQPNAEDPTGAVIADKLLPEQREVLTHIGNKYYALPHSEYIVGVNYDIDLFEEKLLYFKDDGNGGADGFITSLNDKKSVGPDNKYGTADDGLPVSYKEFFELCEYMSIDKGVTPFTWAGDNEGCPCSMWKALAMVYEGAEGNNRLDFNGTVNAVVGYENTATQFTETVAFKKAVTEAVPITFENGYEVARSEGWYYATQFYYNIIKNDWFNKMSYSTTYTWLEAQEEYLYSRLENKPVAFLVDGNYWLNEAKDAASRTVEDYGDRAKLENRRFGFLPLPNILDGKAVESVAKTRYLNDFSSAFAFINKEAVTKTGKTELAKKFLQFAYTQESLEEFSVTTGANKALKYELKPENYNKLSTYSKSMWDLKNNADLIYGLPYVEAAYEDGSICTSEMWQGSRIEDRGYMSPVSAFKNLREDPVDFFNGIAVLKSKSAWDAAFSKYYNK